MNVIFSFFSNRRASSDILFESSKNWDLFQESCSVLQDFENISNNLEGTCNTCFADGLRCNSSATATMCSLPKGYKDPKFLKINNTLFNSSPIGRT